MEISGREKIFLDVRYRSSDLLVKRLVERSAAEEVMKKCRIIKKDPGLTYSGGR